jgi:UDP-GlcNAc:undecaprenyl-phosphate/decaprenyl-phosphate GlcNAc-1-phosphate transferase
MAGLISAAVLSTIWCLVALRLGPAIGLLDLPDGGLKTHRRPAVPLGGVGIFFAVHIALTTDGRLDPGLLAASGILLIAGLIDDRWRVSPWFRLVAALGAGVALMAWSAVAPVDGAALVVTGVLLVVVTVNAVNLLDGLDGLAGSAAAVSAVGLAGLAAMRGLPRAFDLILLGALGGFLLFNWRPARVFLGDNGAYVTGIFLAYGILESSPRDPASGLVIAITMLGVFLVDLAATILRRLRGRKMLFGGDRDHLYDQLHRRGWSVPAVVLVAILVQSGFVALALVLEAGEVGWWSLGVLSVVAAMVLGALGAGGFLQRSSTR